MQPIIEVKNISKKYNIAHKGRGSSYIAFRDILSDIFFHPLLYIKKKFQGDSGEEFWALKNINFKLNEGEVLGIIGHNGAGKSTLLKILSRITPPTEGEVIIRGRVGSLLEVGTGFNPELTGRENILLNGAILGMKKGEIMKKFDEIVEFSGVEKFLDTPVKYYSSGMYVRLAFSVAAHMEPEILIVDEVLAVGDAEFQKKCLGKMDEITKKEGRTILFVSHNMGAIQSLCKSAIVLKGGQMEFAGPVDKAMDIYLNSSRDFFNIPLRDRRDRKGNGVLKFSEIIVETSSGNQEYLVTGKPFKIKAYFDIADGYEELKNVAVSFTINDQINGKHLLAFWTETSGSNFNIGRNRHLFECDVSKCNLISGQYCINVYCTVNGVLSDYIINAARISIDDKEYFSRGVRDHEAHPKYVIDHKWELK